MSTLEKVGARGRGQAVAEVGLLVAGLPVREAANTSSLTI